VNTIVVGFDGSEHASRALDRAMEIAAEGGQLIVVSVARKPADPTFLLTTSGADFGEEDAARTSLDDAEARARAKGRGFTLRTVEAHGDPADMLVQVANNEGADLIVVGSRGLNLAQRAIRLGSVSTKVLYHAACDVLVVH